MEKVLQVKQLCTTIDVGGHAYRVVDDVSFDLFRGRTLAIVGESGCGKTMTALSIMRIAPKPPTHDPQGEILFHGQNLLNLSEKEMRAIRGGKIAMIFQDPTSSLNPVYTIGFQMMEAAELHLNLYGDEAEIRCLKALSEVGIAAPAELINAYPHQLSGGMRQRVMIAMALLCEPDILIADEPTTALDVTIQAQVLDLIRQLQQKKGMAVLLITHDLGVVAELAHEVLVMYASQIVEQGSAVKIFDHREHPYTMALFRARTTLKSTRGSLEVIPGQVPSLTHYPQGCRFAPRCPFAMAKCRHGDVPNFSREVKEGELAHLVKCWLYDQSEESLTKLEEGNRLRLL